MDFLYDITALGELLIDLPQIGDSSRGLPLYEANPGGAPANVLAMANQLGNRCAFLGKVGRDAFGSLLQKTLSDLGICTDGISEDPEIPTTLAVVSTDASGDRSFSFYRSPGADLRLREEDLVPDLLRCRIFHFGSLSLTAEPARSTTRKAVELARKNGALISFDPNLRESLWKSLSQAKEQMLWGVSQCDVLKIADNELEFLTGKTDPEQGIDSLMAAYPRLRLCCVTEGAAGSRCRYQNLSVREKAVDTGPVVDTTGAGDTFCACVLNTLLKDGWSSLNEEGLHRMLRLANTAASIVTTRKGALCSMPDPSEIEAHIR